VQQSTIKGLIMPDGYLRRYTSVGGYSLMYLDHQQRVLCYRCATERIKDVDCVVHFWEGEPMQCDECSTEIESSYGIVD